MRLPMLECGCGARCSALALSLVSLATTAVEPVRATEPMGSSFAHPELAALILNPNLDELSGLAGSRRRDDVLWGLNDGGGQNRIYAMDRDGHLLSTYVVAGETNTDWEEIASFEWQGEPHLLIADVGDNGALRPELKLIVVREPVLREDQAHAELAPAWTLRFRYPDGPRDCEAVTVDAARGEILLMSKRRVPAQLFVLPLQASADPNELLVAKQVALAQNLPQPSAAELAAEPKTGRFIAQVTAMTLAPDESELALLTYRDAYVYPHLRGESWQATLARVPHAVGLPRLPQAEGLAYVRDGSALYITSERLPAPLVRVPRSDSHTAGR
jgi:hypothetical protein